MPHLELLIMETVDQKLCYQFTRNYIISLPTCKWTDSLKVDIDWHAIYLFFFFFQKKYKCPVGRMPMRVQYSPRKEIYLEKRFIIRWSLNEHPVWARTSFMILMMGTFKFCQTDCCLTFHCGYNSNNFMAGLESHGYSLLSVLKIYQHIVSSDPLCHTQSMGH